MLLDQELWRYIVKGLREVSKDEETYQLDRATILEVCKKSDEVCQFYLWFFAEYVFRHIGPAGKFTNPLAPKSVELEPEKQTDNVSLNLDFSG